MQRPIADGRGLRSGVSAGVHLEDLRLVLAFGGRFRVTFRHMLSRCASQTSSAPHVSWPQRQAWNGRAVCCIARRHGLAFFGPFFSSLRNVSYQQCILCPQTIPRHTRLKFSARFSSPQVWLLSPSHGTLRRAHMDIFCPHGNPPPPIFRPKMELLVPDLQELPHVQIPLKVLPNRKLRLQKILNPLQNSNESCSVLNGILASPQMSPYFAPSICMSRHLLT